MLTPAVKPAAAAAATAAAATTATVTSRGSLSFLTGPRCRPRLGAPLSPSLTSLYSGGPPTSAEQEKGAPPKGGGARVQAVLHQLQQLTLLEVSELVRLLERAFGVSAAAAFAAPAAAAAAAGGGPGEAPSGADAAAAAAAKAEKTEFDVVLKGVPTSSRIAVIKTLRSIRNDLGLKEAKNFIDSLPQKVLQKASKEESQKAFDALTAAGGDLEIQ